MTSAPTIALAIQVASDRSEIAAILAVRERVFRDEQHIVESDVRDLEDRESYHVYAASNEGVVSAGRLTPPLAARADAQIAWVATLPAHRGRGAASGVMAKLLEIADRAGYPIVTLSAQRHAIRFYERFGFRAYGTPFFVRGIEHQMMERRRPR